DRQGTGRLQQRCCTRMASGEDDVGRERGQFVRLSANCGGIGCGPAGVDPHIAADDPSQQRQRLLEHPDARLPDRIVRSRGREHANAPHLGALLRARRGRPRSDRAAKQRYELAALHSITSSARASKLGGTSRPKALAVFRLTTNSNLVPCCTGRSAGFAPLRILSTKLAERYHMSLMLAE